MRISNEILFLSMARLLSYRSTCARNAVGCVLVDSRGHVLATGYNGTAAGTGHCIDEHCSGVAAERGTGLDECEAIHAEQNALLQVNDEFAIHTAYCTHSPCVHCVKLLMNTGCREIIFLERYPSDKARSMWLNRNADLDFMPGWYEVLPEDKREVDEIVRHPGDYYNKRVARSPGAVRGRPYWPGYGDERPESIGQGPGVHKK